MIRPLSIGRRNVSLIGNRTSFDSEMSRMMDEMERLTSAFTSYVPALLSSFTTPPLYDPFFDNLQSPLIQDESDGKSLRLRYDVSNYKPEEVSVKVEGNSLHVHAKHQEKGNYEEFSQRFTFPQGTNLGELKSDISTDGVLTVEAPLPKLAVEDKK